MALRDITFFAEDTDFVVRQKQNLREWIGSVVKNEGFTRIAELNFIFCSDDYLLDINKEYLNHDTYTDIITFDSSEAENVIAGDIFISIDRVQENAAKFQVSEKDELHRVIVHGVLHLCGYGDKSKAEKTKMTEKENEYLASRQF